MIYLIKLLLFRLFTIIGWIYTYRQTVYWQWVSSWRSTESLWIHRPASWWSSPCCLYPRPCHCWLNIWHGRGYPVGGQCVYANININIRECRHFLGLNYDWIPNSSLRSIGLIPLNPSFILPLQNQLRCLSRWYMKSSRVHPVLSLP